ncbi:MAG: cyclase family protein [Candidatus Kapabacteria bacterium]|jgi:kynurenine formamidase|nr:cyclase family protein [Candidatus Kapabacteria bacterium]
MLATIKTEHSTFSVDFTKPIDLSLPLRSGEANPNAFGIQNPDFKPFRAGGFVGSVEEGGACNCENLLVNPHGNGTHTECIGHITKERVSINQTLKNFFALAALVSLTPERLHNGDAVITEKQIRSAVKSLHTDVSALILRTLPNTADKQLRRYSGTNPPYLTPEAAEALAVSGIRHFLTDLPSVDREDDGGKLSAHHAFWQYHPDSIYAPRYEATITEMIFAPDDVPDGAYFLNLQIASIESDASPSKPVLYALV